MIGDRPARRSLLILTAFIGVFGSVSVVNGEVLQSTLTDEPRPGDWGLVAPVPLACQGQTGGPGVVYRGLGTSARRGSVGVLEGDEGQWRVFSVLATIMIPPAGVYPDDEPTDPVFVAPSTDKPGKPVPFPPVGKPKHVHHMPEPGTLVLGLVGMTLTGLAHLRKRRRGKTAPPEEGLSVMQAA